MTRGTTRNTRQGAAINAVLQRSPGFRSAQDLHAELRRDGESIGLTTVYRHLQALAEHGLVDVVRAADGEAAYRRCETEAHHHHLVCRRCGRTVEVNDSAVETWAERVVRAAGFIEAEHTVEITGVCGDCGRRPTTPPARNN